MDARVPPASVRPAGSILPLSIRLALRELKGGLYGFGVFLACLALGVWSIAAVGSLSRALTDGLASEGRVILGADLAFSLVQREATPAESAYLAGLGKLSSVATMRAMAVADDDKGSALIELKAVDGSYPTIGELRTDPPAPTPRLFAVGGETYGGVADPALLARLGLEPGDSVRVGNTRIRITASLVSEPDKIADGIGFGPRLLISQEALRASGLLQPGSLVRWNYRLELSPADATEAGLERVAAAANAAFPEAGWDVRSRLNADRRFQRNIERFSQFLSLVGLTALIVGGVGVANSVRGFVDRKRTAIAVMKSLGAPGGRVVRVHLVQVLMIAGIGVAIGLLAGAITPYALSGLLRDVSPIPLQPRLAVAELGLAALYGFGVALAFSIVPLGRAHDIPVAALFRDRVEPDRARVRLIYYAAMVTLLAAIALLALATTAQTRIAATFLGAAGLAFLALRLVASGLMRFARSLPRPRNPQWRLALANIHRPGAATPTLMLSLGLGVTLLTVVVSVDVNLRRNLQQSLPERAPSFFFLDIPAPEVERFDTTIRTTRPEADIDRVPLMRGRIVSVKGVPAEAVKASDEVAWVLRGDRGLTFSQTLPEGSELVAGEWWDADYRGPPLVSFEKEAADGIGVGLGDKVVVNVLGRNIEAQIASLREVEWRSLGINFVMVFSPNTFAGAPHTHLATVTLGADANARTDAALVRELGGTFPTVTAIRVRDSIEAVNEVVGKLMLAVRGASGVILVASLLVLAGALAAGHRARLYDAVILKTLGATRARLIGAYSLEYALVGLAAAVVGIGAGTGAAAYILGSLMRLEFSIAIAETLFVAGAAILSTVALGLIGSWRILGQKPARHLRAT